MDTQTLTGTHKGGSGAAVTGRTVKATPHPGQYASSTTIDTSALVLTSAVNDTTGIWSLTLLQGILYDIKIDKWGTQTILVTDDATKEFVTYLDDNAVLAGPVVGSIKVGSRYIRPILTNEAGETVTPTVGMSIEGLNLGGWEII